MLKILRERLGIILVAIYWSAMLWTVKNTNAYLQLNTYQNDDV